MKKYYFTISLLLIVSLLTGQVENGLIAKYYFNDGTYNDEMGNIDGSPSNTFFTFDRFNNPTSAVGFIVQSQSNISLGDNFDDLFTGENGLFSFSFWIKTSDTSNLGVLIISKYGNSNCFEDQREFFIRINGNKKLEMLFYSTLGYSDYRSIEGSSQFLDTLWHHFVISYSGPDNENDGLNRVKMYFDSNLETTSLLASEGALGDIDDGTAHLGIGSALGSTGNICGGSFFQGSFDDFRIYNRTLNEAEVDTLFNELDPFTGNFEFKQNHFKVDAFPNPFTTSTTIEYILKHLGTVRIEFYNQLGMLVDVIEQNQSAGKQQVVWEALGFPAGVYFCNIKTSAETMTTKIIKLTR